MAGAAGRRKVIASDRTAKPRPAASRKVVVREHVRKAPSRPAAAQPLGAGHAVENLLGAFPELQKGD